MPGSISTKHPSIPGAEQMTLRIEGLTPLVLNNGEMADPTHSFARELSMAHDAVKRDKTPAAHEKKARAQYRGCLYWDDAVGVYLPGVNLMSSFVDGAKTFRKGTALKEGIIDFDSVLKIDPYSDKYDNADQLFDDGHIFRALVKVGTARVPSTRPQFTKWSTTITVVFDAAHIDAKDLLRSAEIAGRLKGVGDARKSLHRRGRYAVTAA